MPGGCSRFGVQSRFDQPWCALDACGCPVQVSVGDNAIELGDDAMAFAMVGVRGLRPGSAVFSASQDVATATRRTYKHIILWGKKRWCGRVWEGRLGDHTMIYFMLYQSLL